MSLENIRKILKKVDAVDYDRGLSSYQDYHDTMEDLANFYGCTLETAAGVFAALSPNNDYIKNLRSAATLLAGHRDRMRVDQLTVSTYNACRARAWRVLEGEPFLSFTKGPKTRNFYTSTVNPQDARAITIDGHMVSLWRGQYQTMNAINASRWSYNAIANDYRSIAFSEFCLPSQLQSMLWFTWKRIHNVLYDGQYSLFDETAGRWKQRWKAAEIKPYPYATP